MKQHIVKHGNHTYHFKETDDWKSIHAGGVQINGNAETITDFIKSLDFENQWMKYGYAIRFVYKQPNSKNMTAFLFRIGDKFLN